MFHTIVLSSERTKRFHTTGATNTVKSNTAQAYNATNLTVNDGMVADYTLTADTLTKRLTNEMTVDSNLAVGGNLLVDTLDTTLANEMSIQDNVAVGLLWA